MKTILLYGQLSKKFGKEHHYDVVNSAEAIRAMCCTIKGFKQHVIDDIKTGYQIFTGSNDLYGDEIHIPSSDMETIRIVPLVFGSGNLFKVILGIAMIGFAFYTGGASLSGMAFGEAGAFFSMTSMGLAKAGLFMILSGVAGMLFTPPTPDSDGYEAANNKPSYAFDGAVNTTRQGNPIAIGYGRMIIGSQVISAGLEVKAINV